MGIPMEYVSFAEVNDAWKAADKDLALEMAQRWQKNAAAVIDVSADTLENICGDVSGYEGRHEEA